MNNDASLGAIAVTLRQIAKKPTLDLMRTNTELISIAKSLKEIANYLKIIANSAKK